VNFLFVVLLLFTLLIAFIGVQFWRGKWLEHLTLIDDPNKFRDGVIAKTSGLMLFSCAFFMFIFSLSTLTEYLFETMIILIIGCIITSIVGYGYLYTRGRKK